MKIRRWGRLIRSLRIKNKIQIARMVKMLRVKV